MSWTVLVGIVLALGLAWLAALARRLELGRMKQRLEERDRALRVGSAKAELQHPIIDLTRCLGCGACVRACPEQGVLELVHGQAVVVNGARCTGVAECERECPVGAITVTLADVAQRRDIPALSLDLEAVGTPGLFLAGEVTAHALIKTAIEQGTAVAAEVSRRTRVAPAAAGATLDLCVVGAGPAGLACSLEAKRLGLSFVTLDQAAGLGGTVAKYPRRKLVLTQPVDLPLHGRLSRTTYTKEELIELWKDIARDHELPIVVGQTIQSLERDSANGSTAFVVHTAEHDYSARNVCLALGRRGSPRKLGVPGEELLKVAYSLLDAATYTNRRILVVGGGESAVEAAVALAQQPGNEVVIAYRQEAFFRTRQRTQERLEAGLASGRLRALFSSTVVAIHADRVDIELRDGPSVGVMSIPNDEVFVMAGGVPPFEMLERAGVSFDPSLRAPVEAVLEQGSGLLRALTIGFALALATLVFALWHADYYGLPTAARPLHDKHADLGPTSALGLWFGIGAVALIVLNLLYLLRRAQRWRIMFGSLRAWMTVHVATGILTLLVAALHAGMAPRDTVGGHAFWALGALVVTGVIGRYLYAYVPRAANGRELELEEVRQRLVHLADTFDGSQRAFLADVRAEVARLVDARQWSDSTFGRLTSLVGGERALRRALARVGERARAAHVPEECVVETLGLARHAYRTSLMAARYEDLRALLSSWRYLHRWVALLMVVLLALHIGYALVYGSTLSDGAAP